MDKDILIELAQRRDNQKYQFYEPCGKMEEFIEMVGSLKYFISLMSAANGVGKTSGAVNILAHMFWPCGNQYFQGEAFKKWPYLKRGRIITSAANIELVIAEMKKWFPVGRYTTSKKGKPYEKYWITDTGWEFDIMSYEQDITEFESATLGWVWFDEPPPESIYKASIGRLRKGGQAWMTETPLKGSAWIYDQILANSNNESGSRGYVEAEVEDACIKHGVRGHLEHEHIVKIISQYSEEDKQARVFGKPQHLTGLIFKQFYQKIHVIKPFNINPEDYTAYEFLDPHPRNPDAVLWGVVDRRGTKYLVDELYLKCTGGDAELAQRIKIKASNYRIDNRRWCDPSAFIEDQHRQTSLAKELAKSGLGYLEASKARVMSDRRIGTALSYQMTNGVMVQAPELYVFENCQRVIFEFLHYSWQEWVGKSQDSHSKREKPMDKDDHMIENIGRFLYMEPEFVEEQIFNETYIAPNFDPYAAKMR